MTRTLALLSLLGALLLAPCVLFGMAMEIAPEQTSRLVWDLSEPDQTPDGDDYQVIGGADGPTAIFISSRVSACSAPSLLLLALLVTNTTVLWRLRPKDGKAAPPSDPPEAQ